MRKEEMKKIKEQLLAKKAELVEMVKKRKEEAEGGEVGDQIDLATNAQIKELDYSLKDSERDTIKKIDDTLEKITKDTYGSCEKCKKEIQIDRLKAQPFSVYCIKCQKDIDTGVIE